MNGSAPIVQKPMSKLAIAGFVLSILGVCLPFLLPFGIVLSIVGIAKTGSGGRHSGQGLAVAGLAVGVLGIFVAGVLAAIAIPNFIRFQGRSKQQECKANLRAAWTAEKAYFVESSTYTDDLAKLGFSPERGNRYAYYLAESGPLEDRSGSKPRSNAHLVGVAVDRVKFPDADPRLDAPVPVPGATLGVSGTCPECSITIACAGNIDGDRTLDLWTISTEQREMDGTNIPAGAPHNDVNDLEN